MNYAQKSLGECIVEQLSLFDPQASGWTCSPSLSVVNGLMIKFLANISDLAYGGLSQWQ